MSLGSNLRDKRRSLKLSQEYVAEQLEVSRQAVSKWETNQSEPTTNNLRRLADLFDCDIREIIYGDEYWEKQRQSVYKNKAHESKKNIRMQMAASFGRVFMLVGFIGYMDIDTSEFISIPWYPYVWWGVLFLIGVALTFVGSRDYFNRRSGSKKIIWFDLLFASLFFLYEFLPFERGINKSVILLFGIVILSIKNIKFFIPTWRKPRVPVK